VATYPPPMPSLSHRDRYATLTRGADTQGTENQTLPPYEPTMAWHDELQYMDRHNLPDPPMFFEQANESAIGATLTSQAAPSTAHASSITTANTSKNAHAMTTAPPVSNLAPSAPTPQVTTQGRFGCAVCPRSFDRFTRAEACHYNHLGWKPHRCRGTCGNAAW
jgi:hypothetical protein